ncbi:Bug family tripartite tricarboxylate transporter substrate binding protein [Roseomonas populi]|uniref:Tripartite tricarboxylate transporter substrate binding protein n=1 Tax=Roseomonas populi TaxID=3121582 RepID=A0ABT1XCF3_9PROT|nr:tripartite tricarboxylate transporter substrate binding protein [Roseomonas pecuniae]MCR0985619.1 tripartite tricarboxylate transporter substrate binding protein [Roseomonas pecuniae]
MRISPSRRAVLAGAAALALPAVAHGADAFPSRPVRLVLGVPPGGAPDVAARLMADGLAARWKQPVVVDNRPAGNGNVAAQAVARGEADGHMLLMAQASILVLNEFLIRSVPYDTERDFVPVSHLMSTPLMIAAGPNLPVKDLAELKRVAKERGGRMTFATSGATNLPRFAGEMLKAALGIEMNNVSYSSVPGAIQDTIMGRTDLVIDGTPVITPQVRGGQLKPIAVTSETRFPTLQDIPTVAETVPGFAAVGWFGLVAPKATPQPAVARIADDMRAVLETPEIKERLLRDFGAEVIASSPETFARFLGAERTRYRTLIKEAGIVPE